MTEPGLFNEAVQELHSLRDFVRWGASRFSEAGLTFGHGTDNALDEALTLVFGTLHLSHELPAGYLDTRLTHTERRAIAQVFERRIRERLPAPYLTHSAWFAGLEFYVDERVLVPRSPIAELIENGFSPWLDADRVMHVLDLCAGSGCIAVACAYAFPEARVDAAELSDAALEVARVNIERHGVDERVRAVASDLFSALGGERYDLIVSNPPYVDRAGMAALPPEYRHEPELGLAAGPDGLDVVLRILREASEHLTADGILVVEVGNSEQALCERCPHVPFLWLDLERGGHGVFLLTAAQLVEHRADF